ncbi:MAG: tetratricopeptide repeat protein [Spirochaetia bacterium]
MKKNVFGHSLDLTRWIPSVLGILLVLLVVGGGISIFRFKASRSNLDEIYTQRLRALDWIATADVNNADVGEDGKLVANEEFKQIVASLDLLTKKSFSGVAQEALFLKGMLFHTQRDHAQAAVFFENAYKKDTQSLLGNKAALNAASAYENINDIPSVTTLYTRVARQKKFTSFAQEATFHLARMTESIDKANALELYKRLIDKVEDGNFWRSLAENRTLILETQS